MFDEPFRLEEFLKPDSKYSLDVPVGIRKGELGGMLEMRLLPATGRHLDIEEIERDLRVSLRKGELGGLLEARLKPWVPGPDDGKRQNEDSGFALSGSEAGY